jgi:ParB family chromosome partitioning protein
MVKRGGLGRGLDALIPGSDVFPAEGNITFVEIIKISPNPRQPRRIFNPEELIELTASVVEYGVLQPLIISPGKNAGEYILVAGERRLQASRLAGLVSVPVVIRETTDMEQLELALIENLQRSDLNSLEEAEAYQQLAIEFNLSHDAIAKKVGKNRVTVSNTLRLLKLPDNVKNALIENRISEGHARALLALSTPEAQTGLLKIILHQDLSVRQTEELVQKYNGKRKEINLKSTTSPEVADLEERLRASLGTKVALRQSKKGGSLTIYYYSSEELELLLGRLIDEKNPL